MPGRLGVEDPLLAFETQRLYADGSVRIPAAACPCEKVARSGGEKAWSVRSHATR